MRHWTLLPDHSHPTATPQARGGGCDCRRYRISRGGRQRWLQAPTGWTTFTVAFRGELRISGPMGEASGTQSFSSSLAGPHTRARLREHGGSYIGLEVALPPWEAFRTFGVTMHELAEQVVQPGQLLGRRFDTLVAALAATRRWEERLHLLDVRLEEWAATGPGYSPGIVGAWQELARSSGTIPIGRLVAGTQWSWRQLQEHFREQIGLLPKAAARVLRLRRALMLLTADRPPAGVATVCGFSDQAHLTRELKAMTGRTAQWYLRGRGTAGGGPRGALTGAGPAWPADTEERLLIL
ncbi:helix-turn-helix domain-containing protein [Streptomyces roseirectus]|uniref:Helix-turn-helix domain-containing protein n=1 Tax=Streptomyces roseirectus TaxID=2768066 RepID=A0A7H0I6B6_9ACTN|nr:helix-turn-helix domain-containing protein [Streptomyces roseirectus]QNP68332.1 helix-turn-helix domain-containing protein [Streptomyces roseirectus]